MHAGAWSLEEDFGSPELEWQVILNYLTLVCEANSGSLRQQVLLTAELSQHPSIPLLFNQLKTWVWTHVCVPVCAQRLISFLPSLYKPRQQEPGASQFCVTSQEPAVPPRLGSQAAKSVELVCGGWESILHARVLFPWHCLPIFLYHSFWRLPQIL